MFRRIIRNKAIKILKSVKDGMTIKSRTVPVARVGCYVPTGVPPTVAVIMTAIPAKMAGVDQIVVVVPPDEKGEIPKSVLAAAAISGVIKYIQ